MFTIYRLQYVLYMSKKKKIVSDVYFDGRRFGSIATTFKDAKAKDTSITLADVRAWGEQT